MGRGEAAEKLSPEEDPRTSTKRGLPCAGISPRTTMRQGVDQPCGIRGSWGIYNPQNIAAIALAWGIYNSAPALGGGGGGGGGGPRLQEGRVRVADGRQDRRGLDEGRDAPPPLSREKGIQSPLSTPRGGLERERGRQVRTAGRRKVVLKERERERPAG